LYYYYDYRTFIYLISKIESCINYSPILCYYNLQLFFRYHTEIIKIIFNNNENILIYYNITILWPLSIWFLYVWKSPKINLSLTPSSCETLTKTIWYVLSFISFTWPYCILKFLLTFLFLLFKTKIHLHKNIIIYFKMFFQRYNNYHVDPVLIFVSLYIVYLSTWSTVKSFLFYVVGRY